MPRSFSLHRVLGLGLLVAAVLFLPGIARGERAISEEEITRATVTLLSDPGAAGRVQAAKEFWNFAVRGTPSGLPTSFWEGQASLRQALLTDTSASVREYAAIALNWMALHFQVASSPRGEAGLEGETWDALRAAAKGDRDSEVRRAAVQALRRNPNGMNGELLDRLLASDKDRWVREQAAYSLGSFDGKKTRRTLLKSLKDGDDFIRHAALTAIVERLDRTHLSIDAPSTSQIDEAYDPYVLGGVQSALQDPDWLVRSNARDALERIRLVRSNLASRGLSPAFAPSPETHR